MIRGEILIELDDSWLIMKTIVVVLSIKTFYRVQNWNNLISKNYNKNDIEKTGNRG